MVKFSRSVRVLCIAFGSCILADNQTDSLTPIRTSKFPAFSISIIDSGITVPGGIHSAAAAQCGDEVLYIAGRTNGLHGFNNDDTNFPPQQQNSNVIVINLKSKRVTIRSLYDPRSGLNQQQIDTLTVTSPQSYQKGNTLYITGGYGVDTATGNFSTKSTLTAINVPGLISWTKHPERKTLATSSIRQISHPIFQVTGGAMYQFGAMPTLLIFGQNFNGFYTPGSDGEYTQQVRRFRIIDNGKYLGVKIQPSTLENPNFRRRDLNVVPQIRLDAYFKKYATYVALSGVFTPSGGAWTVPVEIAANGYASMADPSITTTFKQGMNNYVCPHAELFGRNGTMYTILFGGITYEYFQNGSFVADPELPFTNQVTVVERDYAGEYTQYLLPAEYPVIISTQSNPGNQLLFGAGGRFVPAPGVPQYSNGVLNLKKIKNPIVLGYIIGGIMSTLPNTSSPSDSAASPYIFKVILTPND